MRQAVNRVKHIYTASIPIRILIISALLFTFLCVYLYTFTPFSGKWQLDFVRGSGSEALGHTTIKGENEKNVETHQTPSTPPLDTPGAHQASDSLPRPVDELDWPHNSSEAPLNATASTHEEININHENKQNFSIINRNASINPLVSSSSSPLSYPPLSLSSLCMLLSYFSSLLFSFLVPCVSSACTVEADTGTSATNVHVDSQWITCKFIKQHFGAQQLHSAIEHISRVYELHQLTPPSFNNTPSIKQALLASLGIQCDQRVLARYSMLLPIVHALRHYNLSTLFDSLDGLQQPSFPSSLRLSPSDGAAPLDSSVTADKLALLFASLHALFDQLPVVALSVDVHWGSRIELNVLSGSLLALHCDEHAAVDEGKTMQLQPAIYTHTRINKVDAAYTSFITQLAWARHQAMIDTAAPTFIESSDDNFWAQPLLPFLPSVCSLSSFRRPAATRRCLAHNRILFSGDSTLHELAAHLIDWLEQVDDEVPEGDPLATRWSKPFSTHAHQHTQQQQQQQQQQQDHASHAHQQSQHRSSTRAYGLFFLRAWVPPDACAGPIERASRMFNTARFPSPYLAAYNITIVLRWNVHVNACLNYQHISHSYSLPLLKSMYGNMRDSCLSVNALEFVHRVVALAVNTSDTLAPDRLTPLEYMRFVNQRYHLHQRDIPLPPHGCTLLHGNLQASNTDSRTFFTDQQFDQWADQPGNLLPSHLYQHLRISPHLRFDSAIFLLGPHYICDLLWCRQKVSIDPLVLERSMRYTLAWTRHMARHVVIKELNYRTHGRRQHLLNFQHQLYQHEKNELTLLLQHSVADVMHELGAPVPPPPPPPLTSADEQRWFANDSLAQQCPPLLAKTRFPVAARDAHLLSPISFLPEWRVTRFTVNMSDPTHCGAYGQHPLEQDAGGVHLRSTVCMQVIDQLIDILCQETKTYTHFQSLIVSPSNR